ncbi:hypothetical protein [Heliophilum fasciatum]|uniref:SipL SPOCS domain-containing protein n=1 Tax=Heliophilum fasciatum TaxID=35700 RepID=A0A4R2RZB9_9FIRM|nr:hypothetical protein [Heliophilum fasciatum]MCW2277015.1 hypothetical protein [Heliophilum fasciatum]TCP68459.1 hypothetical protein EDD73_10390 [Heliophilum fasciatum]
MDTKNGTIELFAQVVVAKNIQKDEPIFFSLDTSVVPPRVIPQRVCLQNVNGRPIVAIENIIFDFDRREDVIVNINGNVTITINFELVFLVKSAEGTRAVDVIPGTFTKIIQLDEFCPSLTVAELADEVEDAEVLVRNVRFDVVLRRGETCTPGDSAVATGTPADVLVFADVIVKLTRFTDVVVYGELDMEKEC